MGANESRLSSSKLVFSSHNIREGGTHNSKNYNLMMLPSTISRKGHVIRRIGKDIVNYEEELILVKKRANYSRTCQLLSNSSHNYSEAENIDLKPGTAPSDFDYLRVIGSGGMGKVCLVRYKHNRKLYAMKILPKLLMKEKSTADRILSERDVLGGTTHQFLVHLFWAFQTETQLCLVMDYCPGGELSSHLNAAIRFTEDVALFFAAEIVLALEHLHRHGIIYRDLKPENILLTEDGHIKLVDFGISKFGITEATCGAKSICGSYEYLAPEVWQGRGYGIAVDWWAFGVVLYEMLTGLPPWYSYNAAQMRENVLRQRLPLPSYLSNASKRILKQLLCVEPHERLGSKSGSNEIKNHVFFRKVDWEMVTFRELHPPIQPCRSEKSIIEAVNFDPDYVQLPIESIESRGDNDLKDFDFEYNDVKIDYGYSREIRFAD